MADEGFNLTDFFSDTRYETWLARVEQDLKGASFDKKLVTKTVDGMEIQPLYQRDNDPQTPTGTPGFRPFTRGGRASGGILEGWDIRQSIDHPDPAKANTAALEDLNGGSRSVLIRFDQVIRRGEQGSAETLKQHAGRGGVMVYDMDDMACLLDGVHLSMAAFALEAGAGFLPAATTLVAYGLSRGVAPSQLKGNFGADPLGCLAAEGVLPAGLAELHSQLAILAGWTAEKLPGVAAIEVNATPYHLAGGGAVQELAFAMATGLSYLRILTESGMGLAEAARQIAFRFPAGCCFFRETAKLRAARALWSKITGSCGAEHAPAGLYVVTSPRVLTKRDPWVNMLRNTAACFAGAMAGADAITTEPFDGLLGPASSQARRIARNTQIILQEESHLHRVMDPAGGSWFLESLTEQLAARAWQLFRTIEARGGMAHSLISGWVAGEIDGVYRERSARLATRKQAVTGVNEFPNLEETLPEAEVIDRGYLAEKAFTRLREKQGSLNTLPILSQTASPAQFCRNLVQAAKNGLPMSSMAMAICPNSEPTLIKALPRHRDAEPFEWLREASDRYLEEKGRRPGVFLFNPGTPAEFTARASFAKNLFETGGFSVEAGQPFAHMEQGLKAFADSGRRIAIVCGTDAFYKDHALPLASRLKSLGARDIVLAGHPGERREAYERAGYDHFIYLNCNVLDLLRTLLKREGVGL